jgi:hypothetical protein
MRVRSCHPGISVDEIVRATSFTLSIPDDVQETRAPTAAELQLLRTVLDPGSLRDRDVKR